MRIGVDARCLEEERISGVGEYFFELLKNILKINKTDEFILFSNSFRQKSSRHLDYFGKYPNAEIKRFRFPNKLLNFCFWYLGWPKIDRMAGKVDVFFAPNINFISISSNCPLITTFHDLSYERFPELFSAKSRLWHRYFASPRKIAKKSRRIIAVSESTKKDLQEIYNADPEKIKVIYHGVSEDFRVIDRNNLKLLEIQKKYNLPYKFILYLGNIEPRKNTESIIEAFKKFRLKNQKLDSYKLVFAGSVNPLCHDIIEREKDSVAMCGYVARTDRPYIYNLASLFVYPSFFEGFGLPVLEAIACGTPVIASNNSSIPEVAGDAAILVNSHRPDEIADAIEILLKDEKLYNKIKEKGLRQAQKFNWKKCAQETIKELTNLKTNLEQM